MSNNLPSNTKSSNVIPVSQSVEFSELSRENCVFQVRSPVSEQSLPHKARVLLLALLSLARVQHWRCTDDPTWFRVPEALWEGFQVGCWTDAINFLVQEKWLAIQVKTASKTMEVR